MELLLQVDCPDGSGSGVRVVRVGHGQPADLHDPHFHSHPITLYRRGVAREFREDLLPGLPVPDSLGYPTHVVLAHLGCISICNRFGRKQGANPRLSLRRGPSPRLQQACDALELPVHQEVQRHGRLGADRKHPGGDVLGQMLTEDPLKQVIEQSYCGSGAVIQQSLVHHEVPVLLRVPHGVYVTDDPRFLVGQLDALDLLATVDGLLERDRLLAALVEDPLVLLNLLDRLQQHLECVLEAEEHRRGPTLAVQSVEGRDPRAQRCKGLSPQYTHVIGLSRHKGRLALAHATEGRVASFELT